MSSTQLTAQTYAVRDGNGKVDLSKTAANYQASNPGAQMSYNQVFKQFEGSFNSREISRGATGSSTAFSPVVTDNDSSVTQVKFKQADTPNYTTSQSYGFPPSPFQFTMTA